MGESMIRTSALRLLLPGSAMLCVLACPDAVAGSPSVQKQFEREVRTCQRDPQYRVGGAAIGECLVVASSERDTRIGHQLQALSDNRCRDVAAAMAAAQRQWQDYRDRQCGLYQALFDNTAMYVNGAACRLRVTLQREDELQQLAELQPALRTPCE